MSNRGEGPFNCCNGPHSYSSSHSSVSGDESAAEAWEAVDTQQAAEAEQAVDVEHATDAEQAGDVENAAVFQEMHKVFQGMQQELDNRRQRMEHSRQQATPQTAGNTTATVSRGQQMASQVTVAQHTAAAGYYGPQPGQRAAGLAAGGGRQKRAPSQAVLSRQ